MKVTTLILISALVIESGAAQANQADPAVPARRRTYCTESSVWMGFGRSSMWCECIDRT